MGRERGREGSREGKREGGKEGGRIGKNQNGMYVHVAMALITYLHPQNDVGVVLLMRMWGGGSSEE